MLRRRWPGLILLVFLVFSCAGKGPRLRIAAHGESGICRVAVLPFVNQTRREGAGELVTRVVIAELVNSGLEVTEEGVVKRFLERERCLPGESIPARVMEKMGEELGIKAVVGGMVTEAREVGDQVRLGFFLWVKDVRDGHFLWGTYYVKDGEDYRKILHFGKVSSLSGLAQRMVHEVVRTSMKRSLFRCRVSS
ncbi:hypothetical protein [Thermosulfurimonas sp. F29]|uniref:hypothetical protein n=1 Tax=Thermosulfurimonas sp. F29 TaxID=2867247 RepID=UPI001C8383BB|nr:hypothetical protein [Thermosulfurimonas sp. F29]MBX6422060.1 hypothetical protein [Thermosulfurimonas sp. F29]